MIRIEDILSVDRILLDLQATNKVDVLRELVEQLAQVGAVRHVDEVHRLLIERESLMTTGVKRGFGFPHAFSPQFEQSFLSLGYSPRGVDYAALDRQPVHFIFLLLGPPAHQTLHLRILARVSRLVGQSGILEALKQAVTPKATLEYLVDAERQLKTFPYQASERV